MSLNSGRSNSNSKRSRNSNSSNTGKRSKNTDQKTLGAAWGSKSNSASRSSYRSAPFSDFGSYMVVKNQKLHEQFEAEASTSTHSQSGSAKPIFHGVSIFVDGFTIPSSQELRGYMLKHGGRFQNYFSRRHVTHIICSNLPDSKMKNIRSFSRGLPVVKPTWILDSVTAHKLLSWVPYQLDQLASHASNQAKLSTFFPLNVEQRISNYSNITNGMMGYEARDTQSNETDSGQGNGFEVDNSPEGIASPLGEVNDQEQKCSLQEIALPQVEISCSNGTRDHNLKDETQCNALLPSTSTRCLSSDEIPMKGSPGSLTTDQPSYPRHSTAEDPNFVENYFKNSRLHFIGTWRQRYRKRFPSLPMGVKDTNFGASTPASTRRTTIIHIDMDCFFVAVIVRDRSDLRDKPVAVCHSDSSKGTAEISSANYPARDYGVRAGMFVKDAKALCPLLVIVPYNFKAYEEVADKFYDILHKYCSKVQAVSCDEAFLDVTDVEEMSPEVLAAEIRSDIFEATGCTASAGISGNLLMARLATRAAKPDGQCHIPPEKADEYLIQLPVTALPGIGRVLEEKLKCKQVQTCGQLRMMTKEFLQKDFGTKTGDMLWNYCRGLDNRLVGIIQESKSIGAEVNWGVRFKDAKDSQHFLSHLCKEVSLRLQGCGLQGRTFTLRIKKRKKGAGEPTKYMGCGDCDNLSHSTTIPCATDDVEVLQRIVMQLFGYFHIDAKDIRGVGLQVSKLESADYSKQGHSRNTLRSWLAGGTESTKEEAKPHISADARREIGQSSGSNQLSALPSLCELDIDVIKSLPPELILEINDMYGGKLTTLVDKGKGKTDDLRGSLHSTLLTQAAKDQVKASCAVQIKNECKDDQPGCSKDMELRSDSPPHDRPEDIQHSIHQSDERFDLMPSSLSQVDASILQQLPEELKADIIGQLPAHRKSNQILARGQRSQDAAGPRMPEDINAYDELPDQKGDLWRGNPPRWVDKFKSSNCLLLNLFGEAYDCSGISEQLSSILQRLFSQPLAILDASDDETGEAVSSLCDLMKQYIKLKLEVDIEEIYICFRVLKRLSLRSKLLLVVFEGLYPHLQACVADVYGGNLNISPHE